MIKYSCFISYPHGTGNILKEFMEQLKQALIDSLGVYLREGVYMDDTHEGGYDFNHGIARAICESVCMIVVYSPLYGTSKYCLREFLAMETIEKKRKKKIGSKYHSNDRMIIPIILRGLPDIPAKIKKIHYYDFSQFRLASPKITKNDKDVIEKIAKKIYDHYNNLKTVHSNIIDDECNEFILPTEDDALKEWGQSVSQIGFPGRKTV